MKTNDEIVKHVYKTTEYSKFKLSLANRGGKIVDEDHVLELAEIIERDGQTTPIQVDSNYGVIMGHHRIKACELLGIPVLYEFSENKGIRAIAQDHSSVLDWKFVEYIKSFAFKNPHYKKLQNLLDNSGLSPGSTFVLLNGKPVIGRSQYHKNIINGNFKFDETLVSTYTKRLMVIQALSKVADGVFSKTIEATKFLQVLLPYVEHDDFNMNHFVKRLIANKGNPDVISTNNKLLINAEHLENLYNQQLRGLKPIYISYMFKKGYRNSVTKDTKARRTPLEIVEQD